LLAGLVIGSVALVVAFGFGLDVPDLAVGWLLSLALLFFAGWLGEKLKPRTRTLADVEGELVKDVRDRWNRQVTLWNSHNPGMLVAWQADPTAMAEWDSLCRAASVPGGQSSVRDDWHQGFSGLSGGASDGGTGIADVFLSRVPTRRLVVLGEAGTGKTTLLASLVLGLLAQPSRLERVPVLVPLASWDVEAMEFHEWLEMLLPAQHRCLGGSTPRAADELPLVRALLREQRLLLVLDGLDELPEMVQRVALQKINGSLRPGEPLVLASRPEAYRWAAGLDVHAPPWPAAAWLSGAAAITLLPLDDAAVEAYVAGDVPNQGYAERWTPVIARLRSHETEPLAEVMRVPLMVWLARSIYGPGGNASPDQAGRLPDPVELCDRERFPSVSELKEHLFRNFVPSAYRSGGDPARRCWDAERAGKILSCLARNPQLLWNRVDYGTLPPGIQWLGQAVGALVAAGECWLVLQAVDRFLGPFPAWLTWVPVVWLAYVLLYTAGGFLLAHAEALSAPVGWWGWPVIAVAAAAWRLGWPGLWTVGWCVGAAVAFLVTEEDPSYARYDRWSARLESGTGWLFWGGVCCAIAAAVGSFRAHLLIGLVCGLAYRLLAALGQQLHPRVVPFWGWLATKMHLAGVVGVAVAMALDLDWHGLDPDDLVSGWPRTPLVAALVCWLIAVVVSNGRYYWRSNEFPPTPLLPRVGWPEAVVVLPVALWFGHGMEPDWRALGAGVLAAAWRPLILSSPYGRARLLLMSLPARAYLALHDRLPWDLRSFLEDAHERGVLRRNGTFYAFRHIELQRYLAGRS
jgi:hypothetical protein